MSAFTGRRAELDQLTALLPTPRAGAGAVRPVVISAVAGTAGVGKPTF